MIILFFENLPVFFQEQKLQSEFRGLFWIGWGRGKIEEGKEQKKMMKFLCQYHRKIYFYAFQAQLCIIILKTMEPQQQKHQIQVKVQEKVQNTLSENRHSPNLNLYASKQSISYLIDRKNCNKNQSPEKNCALRDLDKWEPAQIQQLFQFYDEHGPQWKNMSISMPYRTANNLKNKFYTVLRNLIKTIFRRNANLCPKMTGEISSRDLCRLYDGREDYQIYANFIRELLQEINYDLESPQLDELLSSRTEFIKGIYQIIYKEKLAEIQFTSSAGGSQHNIDSPLGKRVRESEMREQAVIYGNQVGAQYRDGNVPSSTEGGYYIYFFPQPTYIWPQSFY